MAVSDRIWSCWSPSRLVHHGDLRSSQYSKPQKIHRPPFEWKNRSCSDILSDALSLKSHLSLQPSFAALSSWAIFMFQWIRRRSFKKHSPWTVVFYLVMSLWLCRATTSRYFAWPTVSFLHFLSNFFDIGISLFSFMRDINLYIFSV